MVIACTCRHENQDRLHGAGKRTANRREPLSLASGPRFRCTACGTTWQFGHVLVVECFAVSELCDEAQAQFAKILPRLQEPTNA